MPTTKKKSTKAKTKKPTNDPQGYSLHIGVNRVSTRHYKGWAGELRAPEADARAMRAIAKKHGFGKIKTLSTTRAKREAVIDTLLLYAKLAKSGDLVFITYSGHGGQVKDLNKDETDFKDETWCLYNGQLIDDELFWCFSKFKKGVRILGILDSCHSGSAFKDMSEGKKKDPYPRRKKKVVPQQQLFDTWTKNADFYKEIGRQPKLKGARAKIKASVIQISACQDSEVAFDGSKNSLFTEYVLKVWKKGKFDGTHKQFRDQINEDIPMGTPNLLQFGPKNASFTRSAPFHL